MTDNRKLANDELRAIIAARRTARGGTIALILPEPPPVNRLANRILRAGFGCADENGDNDDGHEERQ